MKTKTRTKVCYFGEMVDLWDLATDAGLRNKTVLKRWRLVGRPTDITLISELFRPSQKANPPTFDVDGVRMTIKAAAIKFGVSQNTIRSKIAKYGTCVKAGQLRVNKNMQKHKKGAWPEGRPAQKVVEDKEIGWAERKYFPSTGSAGFSKAAKSGVNAHCDRCTILPILSGD